MAVTGYTVANQPDVTERILMKKLIAMLLAAVFAGASVTAIAQGKDDKKDAAKKGAPASDKKDDKAKK